jgi:hypothetical protein
MVEFGVSGEGLTGKLENFNAKVFKDVLVVNIK